MKARIKETGEIVDVYHEPQHGQITNIYKESVFVNGRIWTEDELIFLDVPEDEESDLEQEIQNIIHERFHDFYGIVNSATGEYATVNDLVNVAKYFYELGKAQKGE